MKIKFIQAYMDVAERFAQLSSATRLQVGAIVVKDDRIISIGYNGMPTGWDNCCEDVVKEDESEKPLTDRDKKQREKFVKGMKKNMKGFKQDYGKDAKSVMYATATKMAQETP